MKADRVLSPECKVGMCWLCSGTGPVYAPGKRCPSEPPVEILRCDHRCIHPGRRYRSER